MDHRVAAATAWINTRDLLNIAIPFAEGPRVKFSPRIPSALPTGGCHSRTLSRTGNFTQNSTFPEISTAFTFILDFGFRARSFFFRFKFLEIISRKMLAETKNSIGIETSSWPVIFFFIFVQFFARFNFFGNCFYENWWLEKLNWWIIHEENQ